VNRNLLARLSIISSSLAHDRSGWWLAGLVAAVALTVYLVTLAPGLTFANHGTDGGDLIAAARTLGVPHPSGYPTYIVLAWLFTHIPMGVIAYRVNVFSAVCAAAAVGLFFRTAQRLLAGDEPPLLLPTAAALTLAFSSLLWSQAVISEVYALLMLFAALLFWLLVRWRDGGGHGYLWLAAFALGLGLGNHLTLVFVAPAAAVFLWPERRRWLRFRVLLPAVALFIAGLGIYAYLPLAARHRPPVNWGNPQTLKGFLWVVTGQQYQQFAFGLGMEDIPGRIYAWAGMLGDQFGWWGLTLALAGAWGWWQRDRHLAFFALIWIFLSIVYAFFYNTADSHMYLMPAVLMMALWWGEGIGDLYGLVRRSWPRWQPVALALVILLPLGSLALHWRTVEPDDDWEVHAYIHRVLEAVEPGGLVIVRGDGPTFALWYGLYAEEQRADVAVVSGPLLAYIWYRDHVRHLYPYIVVNEPTGASVTWDDLVRDLVVSNWPRPTYATDPKELWEEWFDFVSEGDSPISRVYIKRRSER
jgi:hypothetical protein